MQLTLHVTDNCNLNCKYCFVSRNPARMSKEVAFAAAKLGMEDKKKSGLLFYGGEPLLEKNLIHDVVAYTQDIAQKTGHMFYYKMTTNGTLLDEDFLKFSKDIGMALGFSYDGDAQDDCRLFHSGEGSQALLEEKIPLLLKYHPYAVGMSVIDPSTVHKASATVQSLFEKGFKYITINPNYSRSAPWTRERLAVLEAEYQKMAEMYIRWTTAESKFYLSPFDVKILSHLKGEKYHADRRAMGKNQPAVATDGKIYSSSKFIGNPAFEIGDVFSGIDTKKQDAIFEKGAIPLLQCKGCALLSRCNYAYDSLDYVGQAYAPDISPVQCAHEQMIAPIADRVAQKLYADKNPLFIHKHYNALYPMMSLVEDTGR